MCIFASVTNTVFLIIFCCSGIQNEFIYPQKLYFYIQYTFHIPIKLYECLTHWLPNYCLTHWQPNYMHDTWIFLNIIHNSQFSSEMTWIFASLVLLKLCILSNGTKPYDCSYYFFRSTVNGSKSSKSLINLLDTWTFRWINHFRTWF